jgi:hypothetical protein
MNCTPKVRHNTFGVQFILTQPGLFVNADRLVVYGVDDFEF